jgi:hypothetical protein
MFSAHNFRFQANEYLGVIPKLKQYTVEEADEEVSGTSNDSP